MRAAARHGLRKNRAALTFSQRSSGGTLGGSFGEYGNAAQFTPTSAFTVYSIDVYVNTLANIGTMRVGIATGASVAATAPGSASWVGGGSNYVDVLGSSLAAGWNTITLPTPAALSSGTEYAVVQAGQDGTLGDKGLGYSLSANASPVGLTLGTFYYSNTSSNWTTTTAYNMFRLNGF